MSRHICRSIGRRTLINKGYSKEIAIIYTLRAWAAIACRSVTIFYRTYASLYVCMHTCWCHVTRAFSFHARCMWCPLLRNQSTAAARHDHCVSSLHLCLSLSAIALPPRLELEQKLRISIKYLNRRLELDAYAIRKEGKYFCVNK